MPTTEEVVKIEERYMRKLTKRVSAAVDQVHGTHDKELVVTVYKDRQRTTMSEIGGYKKNRYGMEGKRHTVKRMTELMRRHMNKYMVIEVVS